MMTLEQIEEEGKQLAAARREALEGIAALQQRLVYINDRANQLVGAAAVLKEIADSGGDNGKEEAGAIENSGNSELAE